MKRPRLWWPTCWALAIALSLPLTSPAAQPPDAPDGDDGLVVHLDEPAYVAADRQAVALAVFGADARVDGTVQNTLLVVDGQATVRGAVHGDVIVVDGALALGPRALVTGDVTLYGSTLTRSAGAEVLGAVHDEAALEISRAAALFWWVSGTLAFIALALGIVALFGARPGPVRVARQSTGRAVLVGIALVLAVPALAVAAFMTGIGLGVGLLVLAALPGLLVAGYVVGGLALGVAGVERFRPDWLYRSWGPYAAAALGVAVLQVLWVVPVLGLLVPLASAGGAGALALHAVRNRHRGAEWPEDGAPGGDTARVLDPPAVAYS